MSVSGIITEKPEGEFRIGDYIMKGRQRQRKRERERERERKVIEM